MKKFFVFLLIVAGCLFLLYKTGNLPVDTIKAQIMSQMPVNNGGGNTTNVQPQVQTPIETQANRLPVGAVKEGKALIEGIVVARGNEIIDNTYKTIIDKMMAGSKKPEVHILTAFNSKTLGKVVLIDNNTIDGTRLFYNIDNGKSFLGVSGDKFINSPAEERLQAYAVMKGLAKAIDGNK